MEHEQTMTTSAGVAERRERPGVPDAAESRGRVSSSRNRLAAQEVSGDVAYFAIGFVNLYFVGSPGGAWALVDAGLPRSDSLTRREAARRFGEGSPPEAIILTHGHFDHAGAALALAEAWDVPIYAHPLEIPYLTGRSDYPPGDPTMGGAIAQLSRVFPHSGPDLGDRVRPLPADGSVPGIPEARWLHTPGHTAGHVSIFRDSDRLLLAGDALTTMDLDSWFSNITEAQEFDRPPAPLTTDWDAALCSVRQLAALEPRAVGAGHGIPMVGSEVAGMLSAFAERFPIPVRGRYVRQPARADVSGVTELPPPVADPLPARAALAAVAMLSIGGLARAAKRRRRP